VVAGVGAFVYAVPISLVIATLLAIVAFSYRQTIHAYPTGGGAYIVAKENIGPSAGLIAAASLLVDYTLTVAVSISAGVLAITSGVSRLEPYRVEMCLGFLAILTIGNLRGIRESGNIFAGPDLLLRRQHRVAPDRGTVSLPHRRHRPGRCAAALQRRQQPLTTLLLLTAFANGCTAMTGVEAVSNGVPAFRAARGEELPRRRWSRWRRWRS
jgi:amino acid transporter